MKTFSKLSIIAILLFATGNAYGGYAYCKAGNNLNNPLIAEVVGEEVHQPSLVDKKSLRPLVKLACESALKKCLEQRGQRIDRAVGMVGPQKFKKRMMRLANNPCEIQQAQLIGEGGYAVYSYQNMVGKTEFKQKKLSTYKTFARARMSLLPGDKYQTTSGVLAMQTDGNLVFYRSSDGAATWSSKGSSKNSINHGSGSLDGHVAIFQADGNFVIYNWNKKAVFATKTHNSGASALIIQADGNVVIYNRHNNALYDTWSDQ